MDYQVNLGFFEGPLDLLFHLVKKHKLEVNQISLSQVTEQYLAYIRQMQERDLDFAGDFLVTAAQLMEIKSKTLLPSQQDGEGVDSAPHELITRLLEYKKFKELASVLKEKEEVGEQYFTRNNEYIVDEIITDLPDFNPLENVTLEDFRWAFIKALKEAAIREANKVLDDESNNPLEIKPEEFNVKDKMMEIEAIIEESYEGVEFHTLFSNSASRLEVVITFLALLELMKLKKIKVSQNNLFGKIMICCWGEFDG